MAFFLPDGYNQALPSFIMPVNGRFEVNHSTSTHDKSAPHGSRGLIKAF